MQEVITVVNTDRAIVRIHPGKSYEHTMELIKEALIQFARNEQKKGA